MIPYLLIILLSLHICKIFSFSFPKMVEIPKFVISSINNEYLSEDDLVKQFSKPIPPITIDITTKSPFCMSLDELSIALGGMGKAKNFWSMIREGEDIFHENSLFSLKTKEIVTYLFRNQINYSRLNSKPIRQGSSVYSLEELSPSDISIFPTMIETETISSCGGRKQLHTLSRDHLQIESVLIPHKQLPRTTLCVSSQVGCDRGCIFCATGKMGLVRNLSVDEILSQVYWGKYTIAAAYKRKKNEELHQDEEDRLPHNHHHHQPLKNIVFMGMGDIGMNLDEVSKAVHILTDPQKFAFGSTKVTLSTVGPNPEVFSKLAQLPATLAWSLHSAIPELRKKLVPSSRYYEPSVLRDKLIESLVLYKPSKHQRSVMIAVTLLHAINTGEEDARQLVEFLQPFRDNEIKVNIDLIPYNDIHMDGLERPTDLEIQSFKEILWKAGYNHSVRLTRGEDEAAACGMLATKRHPISQTQ